MLGNTEQISIVKDMAERDRIPHALMFTGEKGMGKKSLAEMLMLSVFGKNERDIKRILEKNHPDIIYVRHEKADVIKVEEIRSQVADTVDIRPYESRYKAYIIPDAEKMNIQAQNTLLKTLEEPPEYCIIVLLVSDEKMMLDTVRSRSMKIALSPVGKEDIRDFLVSSGADEKTADTAAQFAGGNPGRALMLSQSEEFNENFRRAVSICRNVPGLDGYEIALLARKTAAECEDTEGLIDLIEDWYRDALRLKVSDDTGDIHFKGEMSALKRTGGEKVIPACEQARKRLRANVNKEAAMEHLFMVMKGTV